VGVIDSGYRGEVSFRFQLSSSGRTSIHAGWDTKIYEIGDRIGQLLIMPYPQIEIEEVKELEQSLRGEGGFGSSGE